MVCFLCGREVLSGGGWGGSGVLVLWLWGGIFVAGWGVCGVGVTCCGDRVICYIVC